MSRPASAFARALRTTTARRALVAAGVAGVAAYSIDRERLAAATTAVSGLRNHLVSRYVIQLDAAAAAPAAPETATSKFGLDPATQVQHPVTLTPASAPELALVGVGVRTVSFISFKVYSAGFYANDYNLRRLAAVPGWAGYDAAEFAAEKGEALVQSLMDVPTAVAIRIDFGHLRDGFTRTLLARAKDARKRGELSEAEDARVAEGITALKAVFPAGSVPKGSALTLVRTTDGNLFIEFGGRVMGSVHEKWIADNLIRAYFSQQPISPPLRGDAARGFQKYYEESKAN